MLRGDWRERPTVSDLLRHPWFLAEEEEEEERNEEEEEDETLN